MEQDPLLVWVAIQEAVMDHREEDLAEVAISLYGQLGEARAEIGRLRATLRASLGALSVTGPRLRQPPHVVRGLDRVHPVTGIQLGYDVREVVAYRPDGQMQRRGDLGWLGAFRR